MRGHRPRYRGKWVQLQVINANGCSKDNQARRRDNVGRLFVQSPVEPNLMRTFRIVVSVLLQASVLGAALKHA
jgi:hypothetical protein